MEYEADSFWKCGALGIMMFDHALLGRKLSQARESLLISPEEAADTAGLSLQQYQQLEAGQYTDVTGDQILLLSRLYRRDFRWFVTGDYPSAESRVVELFRQNDRLTRADRIAIQEFVRLCEFESSLESSLGRTRPALPTYDPSTYHRTHFKKQGTALAGRERSRMLLGQAPIGNVFSVLRRQGIHLFRRRLEDQTISGLFILHPEAGAGILVNYVDDLYRQNFSAAHEYCHALYDTREQPQSITYAEARTDPKEWRANEFAGEFLVPQQRLRSDYQKPRTQVDARELIMSIARRFRVNAQVAIRRLEALGWLGRDEAGHLAADPALVVPRSEKTEPELQEPLSAGQRARLAALLPRGLSLPYLNLCIQAYQSSEISLGRLSESLFLDTDETTQLLWEWGVPLTVPA